MIKERLEKRTIEIDLTGSQGNAFYLLGMAKQLSEKLGYSKDETQEIQDQLMASNYDHLIDIFELYFGRLVIMYR